MPERDAELIETLHRIASDPEGWDELFEVLEAGAALPDLDPRGAASLRESLMQASAGAPPGAAGVLEPEAGGALHFDAGLRRVGGTPQGEAMLALCGGRAPAGSRPVFDDEVNAEALAAAADKLRGGASPRVVVRFNRRDLNSPLFAFLLRGGPADVRPGRPSPAFLLVFPTLTMAEHLRDALRESFGLTPAEVRLVERLGQGLALTDIAADLGVSIHTTRNQLNSVFNKIGVQRQAEIVRLLLELSAFAPSPIGGWRAPARRSFTLGDGRRLAYREYGHPDGRVLMTFHDGLGSSLFPQSVDGTSHALGLRVIALERPGFGGSDPHRGFGFASVGRDACDLLEGLGVDRAVFAGQMSGAPFAMAAAAGFGDRARGLHFCSGRPPGRSTGQPGPLHRFRAALEGADWLAEPYFQMLALRVGGPLVRQALRRATRRSRGDRAFADAASWAVPYLASYVAEALEQGGRGPADDLGPFRADERIDLADLSAPVTLWHGDEDQMTSLSQLREALGAHPYVVERRAGIGHLMMLKHWPEVFARAAAELSA
ncbi:MAG: alpha/beta fold hydrolase [Phenylobacterium sp.]|uniref:alpha/beta fold hydrolase n=1 Tax=Phenylobacterium sp. TaxID=1871053 RepID=UPI0025D0B346|nr:alpha/beta fold hydrolase [Phenylobacterium sp.]MBI1196887.1 alpha/beta fold hydrolase [Phenylobacterium sp.]